MWSSTTKESVFVGQSITAQTKTKTKTKIKAGTASKCCWRLSSSTSHSHTQEDFEGHVRQLTLDFHSRFPSFLMRHNVWRGGMIPDYFWKKILLLWYPRFTAKFWHPCCRVPCARSSWQENNRLTWAGSYAWHFRLHSEHRTSPLT